MYRENRALGRHAVLLMAICVFLTVFQVPMPFVAQAGDSITVLAPNGDETWQRSRTKSIEWSTFGNAGSSLDMDLSSGGVFLRNIVTATPDDGIYSWSIPADVEPVISAAPPGM